MYGRSLRSASGASAGATDCGQKPESGSIPALTAGGRRENHDPPLWRQWQYVAYRSKSDYAGGVERARITKCSILKRIEIKKSWGPPLRQPYNRDQCIRENLRRQVILH